MYLHAGNNKIILNKCIIGLFDMDNATMGADTRDFLRRAQRDGFLETSGEELPKSFILYEKDRKIKKAAVCISQLSTSALRSRIRKNGRM